MSKKLFLILVGGIIALVALLLGTRAANNDLTDTFELLNTRLDSINNTPDYVMIQEELESFDLQCSEVIGFIEDLKNEIKMGLPYKSGEEEAITNTNRILFNGNQPSARALELLANVAGLRADIALDFGDVYPELVAQSDELLETASFYDAEGYETSWLVYNFKDNSATSTLGRLTELQEDVDYIRLQILEADIE